jgi:hypothetical protein
MSAAPLAISIVEERLQVLAEHAGNITQAAATLGISRGALANTVASQSLRRSGPSPAGHAGRVDLGIDDGVILVGSDAHIMPGTPTIAMHAFEQAIKYFRPRGLKCVVLNGDVCDFTTISRHPSIGWEKKPSLIDELAAVQSQLRRLRQSGGDKIEYIWTLGNHDARFETKVANELPQYAGVRGVHLKDHFPDWRPGWSCWINDDIVIKHRWKGGVHATHNNTVYSGKTIVTGHLHSLRVSPFTDYGGTRFGIDTGCLAAPYSEPFIHYTEGNPVNWRAGFVVLSIRDGRLLWPEVAPVVSDTEWSFRGELYARH